MNISIDEIYAGKYAPWNVDGFLDKVKTGEINREMGMLKRDLTGIPDIRGRF